MPERSVSNVNCGELFVTYMVDKTVFGRVVLGLQCTEKCLLSTKNLYCAGRVLRETEQTTGMADESCTNELPDKCRQVGCNGVHSIAQIFGQLCSVRCDSNHLVAQRVDMVNIRLGDLGTHGDLGGSFYCRLEVFRKDRGKVCCCSICPEAWRDQIISGAVGGEMTSATQRTHSLDDLGIGKVVYDNLA